MGSLHISNSCSLGQSQKTGNGSRLPKKASLSITTRRPPAFSSISNPLVVLSLTQSSNKQSRSCSRSSRQCYKNWRMPKVTGILVQMALVDRNRICKVELTMARTKATPHRMSMRERQANGLGERHRMELLRMGIADGIPNSQISRSTLYQHACHWALQT